MSPRVSVHLSPNAGVNDSGFGFLVRWDSTVLPIIKKFSTNVDKTDDSFAPTTLVTGELFSERLPLSFDPRILFSNQSVDRIFGVGEESIGSLDLNRPDSSTTRNYTTEGVKATKVSNYCNTGVPHVIPLVYQAGGKIYYTLYDERTPEPVIGEVHKSFSIRRHERLGRKSQSRCNVSTSTMCHCRLSD